jgi:uncharacterized protein
VTRVGVVGGSARAAVQSLARAGFSAWAVDQFTDRDLKRLAPCAVCPTDRYPDSIPELAAQFPSGPVLYTGGLENHPRVVRELALVRDLWGNPPEVLERVRDPFALFPVLADAGFTIPRFVPPAAACPAEGRWLRKPIRSAGGHGIRLARPGEGPSSLHFFQESVDGAPLSAQFISDPTEAAPWATKLTGITAQLVGEPWLHARPFAYCGNIGPVELPRGADAQLEVRAVILNERVRMRGLWGLDFIWREGGVHPVEVNPRYTAAVEVLELAWHCSHLVVHDRCFSSAHALVKYRREQRYDTPIGKAIYFAPHSIVFPANGPWDADLAGEFDPWRVPRFADIPEPNRMIEAGAPVFTFFATGPTPVEVRRRLQSRAAELDVLFSGCQP